MVALILYIMGKQVEQIQSQYDWPSRRTRQMQKRHIKRVPAFIMLFLLFPVLVHSQAKLSRRNNHRDNIIQEQEQQELKEMNEQLSNENLELKRQLKEQQLQQQCISNSLGRMTNQTIPQ